MPQLEVRRSEFARRPSPLAGTARLLSGEFIILWKWERMSPVQQVQPSQVRTCSLWNAVLSGALGHPWSACGSLFCCRLWQRVHRRGRVLACVLGKGGNPPHSFLQYIIEKNPLLEFRRARKGLIRSCKHLALYCLQRLL